MNNYYFCILYDTWICFSSMCLLYSCRFWNLFIIITGLCPNPHFFMWYYQQNFFQNIVCNIPPKIMLISTLILMIMYVNQHYFVWTLTLIASTPKFMDIHAYNGGCWFSLAFEILCVFRCVTRRCIRCVHSVGNKHRWFIILITYIICAAVHPSL